MRPLGSTQAAYAAPLILLSQNRQADTLQPQHSPRVTELSRDGSVRPPKACLRRDLVSGVTFVLLALITTAVLAGPLLAALPRLGLPLVVGEIAAGVLPVRTGLGWIDARDPTTVFLSEA